MPLSMSRPTVAANADDAVSSIRSGDRVYVQGGAATPGALVEALVARSRLLTDIEIVHLHTEVPAPYVAPGMERSFRHNALFIGPNVRDAVQRGQADYTPIFLSEIPSLFLPGGALPLDAAFIHITPPDDAGFCSLGVSVDCALAAASHARTVIAQVDASLPRTGGHRFPFSEVDVVLELDTPLPERLPSAPAPEAVRIGRTIAGLIEDGSTLQLGIGSVPDSVLGELTSHRDLGIHTEMFSDGVMHLIEAGVVTGARKTLHPGVTVSSFVLGSKRLYDFLNCNTQIELYPADYTNDPHVIAAHDRMVAINAALSVDLTGQVVADSLGSRFYSGIGGQVDFIRGAARSRGGRPVVCLPSTAVRGTVSRICSELAPGSGVVTTRGDVHWVVTEFGARNLHGRSIRERAAMLIDIAHPDFRASLYEEAGRLGYLRRGD
jgi:acetyl-CoA hydrolase